NYFNTYINRDMRSLFPHIDIIKYQRVMKMLSSISGTIVNKSELARSAESSEKSIRDYLQIISGKFFWRELPAFKASKIKTTTSLPKRHFRDSGLLLFLQNVFTPEELGFYPKLGNVFESFVVEELIRGVQPVATRKVRYYHFRTKAGGEIGLILEGSFGLLPIEIKYQSNTTKKQHINGKLYRTASIALWIGHQQL
ncbi:MAG: ATP-binding protein, partial [Pseudomonadales bacterium]